MLCARGHAEEKAHLEEFVQRPHGKHVNGLASRRVGYTGASAAPGRHVDLELLIEVAVKNLSVPPDAHRVAAHQI